jgi:hypothetical protein
LVVVAQTPTYSGPQETYPGGERIIGRDLSDHNARLRNALEFRSGIKKEPRVIKSGVLAPSATDIQSHKQFLSQKNTGLIRLLPRGAYNINLRGGGSYYSFFHMSHEYGDGSDIGLEIGLMKTGFAGADYGILTNLGDVPLGDLSLEDARVGYLAEYRPLARESDARAEFLRIRKGYTRYGQLYASIAVGEVDCSYLLRSVVYNRSDVLVAFRVVRVDTDGSLIIAWKMLKKYSTPNLSRS